MTKRFPLAHKIDTSHPYTPKDATDIRKTFARIRKQQAAPLPAPEPTPAPKYFVSPAPSVNVTPMRKAKP